MTVKELIDQLQRFDSNLPVAITAVMGHIDGTFDIEENNISIKENDDYNKYFPYVQIIVGTCG